MASPVYQTVSGSSGTATSFTATEPTGAASGDGLLMFVFSDTNPSGFTGPSGWNLEANQTVTDGTNTFQARIYSIRRGGSAPSLGASWTGSTYFEWTIVRISGIIGSGAFVESISSSTPGSGSAPDSPSATPLSANTLALSVGWSWAGFTGSQAQPTGYTLIRQVLNTGNTQAYKTLSTTAAEDPSAWGSGTTSALWANTIIIASQAATGPNITGQPSDAQVAVGATASFSVTASATGGGSLTYQWMVNGTNVSTGSGGTTANYTTGTLALSDTGNVYTCAVTETGGTNDGTTTSSGATLTVGIKRVAIGSAAFSASGGTSVAPSYPTLASGDLLVLQVVQKPSTANSGTVTTPTGWTLETSLTGTNDGNTGGYTTTLGSQTGNVNIFTYTKTATGSESGTLSITVGTNNVCAAQITSYRPPSGYTWSTGSTTGKDTSAGSVSITGGADPGVAAGDFVIAAIGGPTNYGTTATFSGEAFSQTGVTYGTVTETVETGTTTGFRCGLVVWDALATAGPSSAAPTWTATAGGTTTNVRGPGTLLRIRASSSGITALPAGGTSDERPGALSAVALLVSLAGGVTAELPGAAQAGYLELPAGGQTGERSGAASVALAGQQSGLDGGGLGGAVTVALTSAPAGGQTGEQPGAPSAVWVVLLAGGQTLERAGAPSAAFLALPAGGQTTEAPGASQASYLVTPAGGQTGERAGAGLAAFLATPAGGLSGEAYSPLTISLASSLAGGLSEERPGSVVVSTAAVLTVLPTGGLSDERPGFATVLLTAALSGGQSGEQAGAIQAGYAVLPAGGKTEEAAGRSQTGFLVAPAGGGSSEASAGLAVALTSQLAGGVSSEYPGAVQASITDITIRPSGGLSEERPGFATIVLTAALSGGQSGELAGALSNVPLTVLPVGGQTGERAGAAPFLLYVVTPTGVETTGSPGSISVPLTSVLAGALSGEQAGAVTVSSGVVFLQQVGGLSLEAPGSITITLSTSPAGGQSGEQAGAIANTLTASPRGAGSEERPGSIGIGYLLSPAGGVSDERSGAISVPLRATPAGGQSGEQAGSNSIGYLVTLAGGQSGEAAGAGPIRMYLVTPSGMDASGYPGSPTSSMVVTPAGGITAEQAGAVHAGVLSHLIFDFVGGLSEETPGFVRVIVEPLAGPVIKKPIPPMGPSVRVRAFTKTHVRVIGVKKKE